MKKSICFVLVLFTALCVFAAGWKPLNMAFPSRFEKIVQDYNLTKTYSDDSITVYKSEDSGDWIYVYNFGDETKNTKQIYTVFFASLGGVFDSCIKYGEFLGPEKTYKYLMSVMSEENYAIKAQDFQEKSGYHWVHPEKAWRYMFILRKNTYYKMLGLEDFLGIDIPEDVKARYEYFSLWISTNKNLPKFDFELSKEYKKYLKEHK